MNSFLQSVIMRIHEYLQSRQNAITLPRQLNDIHSLFSNQEQIKPEYDLIISIKSNKPQV